MDRDDFKNVVAPQIKQILKSKPLYKQKIKEGKLKDKEE